MGTLVKDTHQAFSPIFVNGPQRRDQRQDKEAIRGILQLGYRCMGGAGAGIILRAGRLTVQRMSKLLTVRNASYCILGLNCSSEDSAQYRKLDSLVKPTISATAGVPYPARKFDAQKKMAALRVGAWPGTD